MAASEKTTNLQSKNEYNSADVHVSLAGITLKVEDVEQALDFYRKLPGANVIAHRPGIVAILKIGTGRLGLLRYGSEPFHLEFETDDVDKLYAELQESGFPVQSAPTKKAWGEYDFTLRDPDGYQIEFESDAPVHDMKE